MAQTYVIDIDDTIIYSTVKKCPECGTPVHRQVAADRTEIDLINKHYDAGDIIIMFTGRDWLKYEETEKQLKEAGVKYHKLIMGKPVGIYVDKDAVTSIGWRNERSGK